MKFRCLSKNSIQSNKWKPFMIFTWTSIYLNNEISFWSFVILVSMKHYSLYNIHRDKENANTKWERKRCKSGVLFNCIICNQINFSQFLYSNILWYFFKERKFFLHLTKKFRNYVFSFFFLSHSSTFIYELRL